MKNAGVSSLVTGIAQGATTATVQSTHGSRFSDPATDGAFNVAIWNSTDYANFAEAFHDFPRQAKIARCTSRAGDVLTITAAEEGTQDVALNTPGKVYAVEEVVSVANVSQLAGVSATDLTHATFSLSPRYPQGVTPTFENGNGTPDKWRFVTTSAALTIEGSAAGAAYVKRLRMLPTGETSIGRVPLTPEASKDLVVQAGAGQDAYFGVFGNQSNERLSIKMLDGGTAEMHHEGNNENIEFHATVATVKTRMMQLRGTDGRIRFDVPISGVSGAHSVNVESSGVGSGVRCSKTGNGHAGEFRQTDGASTSPAVLVNCVHSGDAIQVDHTGDATLLDLNASNVARTVAAVLITAQGTGDGIQVDCPGGAVVLDLNKSGGGAQNAVNVDDDGTGVGIQVTKTGNGQAIRARQQSAGASDAVILIENAGTGNWISTDAGSPGAKLGQDFIWTDGSCYEEIKDDVELVDEDEILRRLDHLRIRRYVGKAAKRAGVEAKILGPFQNDLVALFGLGEEGIRSSELATVAMAAAKVLLRTCRKLDDRLRAIEAQLGIEGSWHMSELAPLSDPPQPADPPPSVLAGV